MGNGAIQCKERANRQVEAPIGHMQPNMTGDGLNTDSAVGMVTWYARTAAHHN